jgi:maltokinase
VSDLIPDYLVAQRWYAGTEAPDPVGVEWSRELWAASGEPTHLWQAVIDAAGTHYQLLIGERSASDRVDFLHGREEAVLGTLEGAIFYDAALDAELARVLLTVASGGSESAKLARPINAEQSNTSLVFDDRMILKVFRRLHEGHNPDVEVTTALASAGFAHVALPLVTWREEPYDLAFGQQFLAGGSEGWALALTSLRDLYNSMADDPAEAGGDFASEARRLGRMTAEMHLALSGSFGGSGADKARDEWSGLVRRIDEKLAEAGQLEGLSGPGGRLELDAMVERSRPLIERLKMLDDPGPFVRVHGDYHLGQVMQTDTGWYVLDFEGEPARPLAERIAPASPLKDVSSMLRSFDYAARHALNERPPADLASLAPLATAWESRNRQAFLEGYREVPDISGLLPDAARTPAVLIAYEIDKALYELDYERAHRPEWVSIPVAALHRLIDGYDDVYPGEDQS